MARLALYATSICLAAFVGLFYFTYFRDGSDSSSLQSGSVQISGSETMRPVVTTCAEEFMTRNPKADVIVRGGGSGDGIAALLHGIVDIGMMSRELSQRERDYAAAKNIHLSVSELALDGVTIIVNRALAVTALGLGQLQAIFAGKIRNWRELEAGDAEVLAFARADGSGTASLFGDRVLRDEAYAASVQRLPTNEAIVAEVATRPAAIGYTDFGAVRRAGARGRAGRGDRSACGSGTGAGVAGDGNDTISQLSAGPDTAFRDRGQSRRHRPRVSRFLLGCRRRGVAAAGGLRRDRTGCPIIL